MHPIVFYSIIKENKIVSFAGTWIMFNEMSQTQKMQIEVIMRYHFTPARTARTKNQSSIILMRRWVEKIESSYILLGGLSNINRWKFQNYKT